MKTKEEIEKREQEIISFGKEYVALCKKYNIACSDGETGGFAPIGVMINDDFSKGFCQNNDKTEVFNWLEEAVNDNIQYITQDMDRKCNEIFDKNGKKLSIGDKVVDEYYPDFEYIVVNDGKSWMFKYLDSIPTTLDLNHIIKVG